MNWNWRIGADWEISRWDRLGTHNCWLLWIAMSQSSYGIGETLAQELRFRSVSASLSNWIDQIMTIVKKLWLVILLSIRFTSSHCSWSSKSEHRKLSFLLWIGVHWAQLCFDKIGLKKIRIASTRTRVGTWRRTFSLAGTAWRTKVDGVCQPVDQPPYMHGDCAFVHWRANENLVTFLDWRSLLLFFLSFHHKTHRHFPAQSICLFWNAACLRTSNKQRCSKLNATSCTGIRRLVSHLSGEFQGTSISCLGFLWAVSVRLQVLTSSSKSVADRVWHWEGSYFLL